MKNRIVTISREFGSGGRTIGKMVAERLNIPCYDQELVEKIAEQTGYNSVYVMRTAFKRIKGMTPNEFRKLNEEETE